MQHMSPWEGGVQSPERGGVTAEAGNGAEAPPAWPAARALMRQWSNPWVASWRCLTLRCVCVRVVVVVGLFLWIFVFFVLS